ncbi:MAG: biopolymer transporter ExbD [Elusimicrobiota bacterium]
MKTTKFPDFPLAGVNIVPLIDIALVLLIIIMITSPVLNIPTLFLKLPKALTTETKERNITITYTKSHQLAINADLVELNSLVPVLRKMLRPKRDVLVIIRADEGLTVGEVEELLEIVTIKAGAKRVAVATQQKTDGVNYGGS